MITEYRRIHLSKEAFLDALASYRRMNEDFLPDGEIVAFDAPKEGPAKISIKMAYGSKEQTVGFDISRDDMLSVIIRACCEMNVPIPKAGKKRIEGCDDGICMHIDLQNDFGVADAGIERASARNMKAV